MNGFYRDVVNGLHFGYPPCCVLWFALGRLLGVDRQAARRGGVDCTRGDDTYGYEEYSFVPCCHRLHSDWSPF